MPKRVAIIPARFNSKRFPGKVLADIAGKSLLRRTYEQALQCRQLSQVIIAADDRRVAEHAREFGAVVVMTDPAHPSGTHRVAEAARQISTDPTDIIVNVQADEPCLDPRILDTLINCLCTTPEAEISTPITPISNLEDLTNPSVVKCVCDTRGRALYFSRSPIPYVQGILPTYYRHLGVYCFRQRALFDFVGMEETPLQQAEDLEQLKFLEHGHTLHVCLVMSQSASVDTPEDVKKVEALLC